MREKPKAVLKSNKEYRDEFLSNMKWSVKLRGASKNAGTDISINLSKKSTTGEFTHLNFTFRNGIEKIILSDVENESLQFCVHKNRIYFRGADASVGYKLYKATAQCSNRYTKIPIFDNAKYFVGDYELKYDDFLELYYIEKERKNGD